MANNGDGGKQIWATEFGEPTSKVDEATQADRIRDFITTWRTLPGADPAFVYTTRDRNTGSSIPRTPTACIEPTARPSRPRT